MGLVKVKNYNAGEGIIVDEFDVLNIDKDIAFNRPDGFYQ